MRISLLLIVVVSAIVGASNAWAFAPDVGSVRGMALQPDGKIIVTGDFYEVDGTPRDRIARLNADGSLDASFQNVAVEEPFGFERIRAVAVQDDGKVVIAGFFTEVNSVPRVGIARLNPDGTLDTGFDPGLGGEGRSVVVQPDGKILVGGEFDTVGGIARGGIARLNGDGSVDTSFDPAGGVGAVGGLGSVLDMALQSDGKVVVAGLFDTFAGQSRDSIARVESNGVLDAAYNPTLMGSNVGVRVHGVRLQSDGKLLVVGTYYVSGTPHGILTRLETNGADDVGFMPDPDDSVYAFAVDNSGRILVVGAFTDIGGTARNGIARLDATGAVDTSFDPGDGLLDDSGYPGFATCVVSQADDKIVAGGSFSVANDAYRRGVVRFEQDGSVDLLPGPDYLVNALSALPDGHILAGGQFSYIDDLRRSRIARLKPDLTGDPDFDPGAGIDDVNPAQAAVTLSWSNSSVKKGAVNATAVQVDGRVILGGEFSTLNNSPRTALARLNPDGSLDTGFNPLLEGLPGEAPFIRAIAVQPNGKVLIGGRFTAVDGEAQAHIARLNVDGSLDMGFRPDVDSYVSCIAIQRDGSVLIGGWFTAVDSQAHTGLARLASDGSLDGTFNPVLGGITPPGAHTIRVQPDGSILFAGMFSEVNGSPRNGIARVTPQGALDSSFDAGFMPVFGVRDVAIQPDGRILVGGHFTASAGAPGNRLVRLMEDGSPDSTFNADVATTHVSVAFASVNKILIEPNGAIVIAGLFSRVDGRLVYNIARLSSDGSLYGTGDRDGEPDSDSGCVSGPGALPGALFLLVVYAARRRRTQLA